MMKIIRCLALAGLLAPLASHAAPTAPAATPASAPVTTLPPSVKKALQANKLTDKALSLVLIPLQGQGRTTVVNADVSVNPASTMKLVTTYAALDLLGPTHQWKTEIRGDGPLRDGTLHGNLYLKGGGDPKLNMEKLWLLLRDLRANGVRNITGDLVLDRSHFGHPSLPEFDDDGGDRNKPFLVTPDSLLVNLKAVRFVTRADGGKISVFAEPPIETIRIDSKVKVLPATRNCPGWPDVRYNPVQQGDSMTVVVSGSLAEGCSSQIYLALLDHPEYAAGTVRALWKELGGSILGADRLGEAPKDARLLARANSPDLVEIIRDINKYSNNTMAQQLFLSIGAHHRDKVDGDDAKAAQRVIRQWLARKKILAAAKRHGIEVSDDADVAQAVS